MATTKNKTRYGLVADIGGTNARFALVELDNTRELVLLSQQTLRCSDFPSVSAAIRRFLEQAELDLDDLHSATIAVAGAVDDDWFEMTNNPWSFSVRAVAAELALDSFVLLNDFGAISWAIPTLNDSDYVVVGGGQVRDGAPVAVVGPGTGLGVGGFVRDDGQFTVLETEGGHASFAPTNELEVEILKTLLKKHARVSWERLLSGPGLENLYWALGEIEGRAVGALTASDITRRALANEDALCLTALNQFCALLGSMAGDLALTLGARGGVYIAGGIVPRFVDFLKQSPFRKRFEAKGRFSAYNAAIPTRLIVTSQPGLLGAAAHQRAWHAPR